MVLPAVVWKLLHQFAVKTIPNRRTTGYRDLDNSPLGTFADDSRLGSVDVKTNQQSSQG